MGEDMSEDIVNAFWASDGMLETLKDINLGATVIAEKQQELTAEEIGILAREMETFSEAALVLLGIMRSALTNLRLAIPEADQ